MAAEDYVGPPGHEKKFHKTHFQVTLDLPWKKKGKQWLKKRRKKLKNKKR